MKRRGAWRFVLAPALGSVLLFSGCAAFFIEEHENIYVTSNPPGAGVWVNGKKSGTAPLRLNVPRHGPRSVIRIEYPGYRPVEIRAKRRVPVGAIMGDILLGLGVGYLVAFIIYMEKGGETVDFGRLTAVSVPASIGACLLVDAVAGTNDISPDDLIVNLTKADGKPKTKTVFLNADDFSGLRWIRVRLDD